MAEGYSWSDLRGGGTYRLPGPEHLGWWAAVAMVFSILFHLAVFVVLDRMKVSLRFEQARELNTRAIQVQQVEVRPIDPIREIPEETVITPPEDAATLLEEVDLLSVLPAEAEVDIAPRIDQAEYALQMADPLQSGDPTAPTEEIPSNLEIEADLPEFGREPIALQPAATGQVTIDPGRMELEDAELGNFTEEVLKQGAGGKLDRGALEGLSSLDELLKLPADVLVGSKTMLPGDLLFEFNSAELRESAKVGLMKLALLMDRNPKMFCWIEGHTDLIGGAEFNLELSKRRAEAVKTYLAESMRMDASRIITRGFGWGDPLVTSGDEQQQSINRRVEIKMRNQPPAEPRPTDPPASTAAPATPQAESQAPRVPRAQPVPEEPAAPRAQAVEAPPLRAVPVEP